MNLQSEKIDQILPALIAARSSFGAAIRSAQNPRFGSKYATLEDVIDAVNKALLSNRIFCTQQTDIMDSRMVLHTRFLHESGQWIGSVYPIHPIKSDPQAEGSALTYARRYALMALAGIAPEDDDGNAATEAADAERAEQAIEDKTQEWIDAIAGCATDADLRDIGAQLRSCALPGPAMKKIRAAWSAKKEALAKAAA